MICFLHASCLEILPDVGGCTIPKGECIAMYLQSTYLGCYATTWAPCVDETGPCASWETAGNPQPL